MTDPNDNFTQRIGKGMVFAAWLLVLALLTWFFSEWLTQQRNPNMSVRTVAGSDGAVILQRNRFGHYVASGEINGQGVEFMLDTGASDVAVPAGVARQLGLKQGIPRSYQTANGIVTAYQTQLETVRLGPIVVHGVRASINPGMQGKGILLGMSFLKQLEFTQRGDTLTLRPMQ